MAVKSTMVELGSPAPDFNLPEVDGGKVGLDDAGEAPAVLVMFLCNHCPYVRHVEDGLADLVADYEDRGVFAVGICSNDAQAYPDDAPERLADQKQRAGFTFPYLVDESQEVGRAYRAACTPDFFVYDADRALFYRGRMDGATPGNDQPVSGEELRGALDAVLADDAPPDPQHPSMGCSIKWRQTAS